MKNINQLCSEIVESFIIFATVLGSKILLIVIIFVIVQLKFVNYLNNLQLIELGK